MRPREASTPPSHYRGDGESRTLRWHSWGSWSSAGLQGRLLWKGAQRSQLGPAVLCWQTQTSWTWKRGHLLSGIIIKGMSPAMDLPFPLPSPPPGSSSDPTSSSFHSAPGTLPAACLCAVVGLCVHVRVGPSTLTRLFKAPSWGPGWRSWLRI